MTTEKATARPWQIHRDTHGVRYEVGPTINNFFTCAYVSGFYLDEAKANAELIVTAVNERDALLTEVAQLKSALQKIQDYDNEREDVAQIIYDWIHEAQVTHRRNYGAIPEDQKQTYRTVADRVIERAGKP